MASISGGAKLMEKLAEMAQIVDNPAHLRVGFLENAKYPDGTPVAMIAAIQDFGAPGVGIPPRPFFRNMIAAKSGEWPAAIAGLLRQENYDAARALALTGEAVVRQLRQSIVDTNSPPLAASTLARRGYSGPAYNPKNPATFGAKPLIDSGHMFNSVDYEVT